jgi:hypothetical protein
MHINIWVNENWLMKCVFIHSVGTFRGTSSKTRHVGHAAWVYVQWMYSPFGMYHEPVFLRTFHETSLHCGC